MIVNPVISNIALLGGTGITLSPSPITSAGTISLTVPVSVADGGTNSSTALANGHIIVSSAGKIIEGAGLYSTGSNIQIGSQSFAVQPALVYSGADSDLSGTLGPYAAFFTAAQQYPLLEIIPYTVGNTQFLFDGYLLSNTYYASGSGNPMRISKGASNLDIQYAGAPGAGSAVTFSVALRVDGSSGQTTIGSPQTQIGQPTLSVVVPAGTSAGAVSLYNTDDSYPHYTVSPQGAGGGDGADDTYVIYDGYLSGSSTPTASSNNSVFTWLKTTSDLRLYANSGTTKGATYTLGATPAITVTSSGITTLAGLKFANSTSGYTPTTLDYYEETTWNATLGGVLSGSVTVSIVRIGKTVTLRFPATTGTASGTGDITMSGFPARFVPTDTITSFMIVGINAAIGWATMNYDTGAGLWYARFNGSGTGYVNGNTAGWTGAANITYTLA